MGDRLIQFTGTECVHCREMDPIVEQLEKELKLKVTKLEVWHNAMNAKFLEEMDKNEDGTVFCGGIPFFFNEKTDAKICGSASLERLKEWAKQ
ncbi:hypothetical protein HQ529_01070 [Candidatus Woesearchaeota archaeon]|nr:hypothetical protein [Candidatus Woesearchaeota archaeon]